VHDLHLGGEAFISPASGCALQHHDGRRGQPGGRGCSPDLFHQTPGRTGTVPPPAGGPGADHVGRIDEQHADQDRAAGTAPPMRTNVRRDRLGSVPMAPDRAATILHADLDAFYASVEQLLDPSLRAHPIAVGGGVVLAASYEARAFGVRAGMAGWIARRLCPNIRFVNGHFAE